ncbi:hypothetical protein E2C01_003585 [Portunus trituberculatus]|uniref:Poly(A) RNA polymerase mitochondrial-like central palm domain-containing protein n=1 Tax=Portunus trituberculatus TaxID=210409 RepID=A0A5B7CQ61_PORTR|nr:hypothetical protein [Portunus trituberculatus]
MQIWQHYRRGIVNYLTPYFPKVVGHIFGSAANNLGFTGCDVDIYLDLGVYPWIEYESKGEKASQGQHSVKKGPLVAGSLKDKKGYPKLGSKCRDTSLSLEINCRSLQEQRMGVHQ